MTSLGYMGAPLGQVTSPGMGGTSPGGGTSPEAPCAPVIPELLLPSGAVPAEPAWLSGGISVLPSPHPGTPHLILCLGNPPGFELSLVLPMFLTPFPS